MSFYKNVGVKHFEDIEKYIKNREWAISTHYDNPSMWTTASPQQSVGNNGYYWFESMSSFISSTRDWYIKKVDEKWFIKETVKVHGSGKIYNEIEITDIISTLYNCMIENKPIIFNYSSDIDAKAYVHINTEILVEKSGKDGIKNILDSVLLNEKTEKINYKRKNFSPYETPEEIDYRRQQWKYASRR